MRWIRLRNIIRYLHNKRNFNRINWLKTLQINFMLLPFNTAIRIPILIYGPCELGVLRGNIQFTEKPNKGIFRIGMTDPWRNISVPSYVSICGNLIIGKGVILRRGIRLHVDECATLHIHNDVSIGVRTSIKATTNISIGTATSIGNDTTITDTDFHYTMNTLNNTIQNNNRAIVIGEQNWIGSYCMIKKGTKTPKGTIIAGPFSMTSKDYTSIINEYSLIAGAPAKLLAQNIRRVNNMQSEMLLNKYFKKNTEPFNVENNQVERFCLPIINLQQ